MSKPPHEVVITIPVWQWDAVSAAEWTHDLIAKLGQVCVNAGGGGLLCPPPTEVTIRRVDREG